MYKCLLNPLSAKFIKWSNTLKQFVGKLPTNCLSVFDHFSGLALIRLKSTAFPDFTDQDIILAIILQFTCKMEIFLLIFIFTVFPVLENSFKLFLFIEFVGNKVKGQISKLVFQESKVCPNFRKTNISYLLIRTRTIFTNSEVKPKRYFLLTLISTFCY